MKPLVFLRTILPALALTHALDACQRHTAAPDPTAQDLSRACSARPGPATTDMPRWLDGHLRDPVARRLLLDVIPTLPPAEQGARLRAEARAHGIAVCPLADIMDFAANYAAGHAH